MRATLTTIAFAGYLANRCAGGGAEGGVAHCFGKRRPGFEVHGGFEDVVAAPRRFRPSGTCSSMVRPLSVSTTFTTERSAPEAGRGRIEIEGKLEEVRQSVAAWVREEGRFAFRSGGFRNGFAATRRVCRAPVSGSSPAFFHQAHGVNRYT